MLIRELRDINLIIFVEWSGLEADIAEDLGQVLRTLLVHPARRYITLLIDSRNRSDELQESANLLLFETILRLTLEESIDISEELNVGLTGQLTSDEWAVAQPLINFRIPIQTEDQQLTQQPNIACIPICELSQISQVSVYQAARLESWCRWGDYFAAHNCAQDAASYYNKYLGDRPHEVDIYVKLNDVWHQAGQIQAAIQTLQTGISNCPQAQELYFWQIIRLKQSHAYLEARSLARQAADRFPDSYGFRLLSHLMLPEIYNTPEEIDYYRFNFQQGLEQITQDLSTRTPDQLKQALSGISNHTNFFLAYQAQNDIQLQQQYGQLVHQIMAANYPQWVQSLPIPLVKGNRPIRVGYLSSFLCAWSGTILFLNWLKYADNQQFEIYSYQIGHQFDSITQLFQSYSKKFYHLPTNLEQICQQVISDRLDILIFPELGMDATTFCIAGLRLAPIQCMAWGQPVTSGLPTIDYFLSSQLMEPANGQEHYTEQLVRLPSVGISYPPIRVGDVCRDRASFGLRDDAIVYISSQAPYKYLPQHDYIYAEIARQVPKAQFMFLRAGIPPARLEQAFTTVGLRSQDYCLFSPVLPRQDYFDLLSLVDIYLDTFDWAGGNTTLDAIACHLPIVTCPGELMRGRHSYGFLQAIGVTETIADDAAHYIKIAVQLAVDSNWRSSICEAIKCSAEVLFDNPTATQNLEIFLTQVTALRSNKVYETNP